MEPAHANARALVERDRATVWHPYTQHGVDPEPLAVASARGSKLVLADGRELLDAIGSWWTCLHGHGHPRLVEALRAQAETLDHVLFAGATHEPAVRLAEELLELAPRHGATPPLTRVFYSDDGSTAVEVALKIVAGAWHHRGEAERTVFLAFEGGYHGDTFGAMAVGDPDPFFTPFRPYLFQVERTAPTVEGLERAFERIGPRLAGLVVEPLVQGAAGMKLHGVEVLRTARALCDAAGIPLVADEVFTGFGRLGAPFACDRAEITPDLLVTAKGLTAGLFPLSATLANEALFGAFLSEDRGRFLPHGHTLTANPIGCAVARASIALLREERVPERLETLGARIHAALAPLEGHAGVRDVRHLGGIVALDLAPPPGESAGYLSSLQPWIRARSVELGVLLRPLGNVLYATPPACLTDAEADRVGAVMCQVVEEALARHAPQ